MTDNKFIAFVEVNHKENEFFIFYIQWNGNEQQLIKLKTVVDDACYDRMGGDYCEFYMSKQDYFLDENVVDAQCKLDVMNNYYDMFSKCVGTFQCPDMETLDCYELAKALNRNFSGCRIKCAFV